MDVNDMGSRQGIRILGEIGLVTEVRHVAPTDRAVWRRFRLRKIPPSSRRSTSEPLLSLPPIMPASSSVGKARFAVYSEQTFLTNGCYTLDSRPKSGVVLVCNLLVFALAAHVNSFHGFFCMSTSDMPRVLCVHSRRRCC